MSDDKREIKVTDRRMFTPDGELREEYRFLHEKSTSPEGADLAAQPPPEPEPVADDRFAAPAALADLDQYGYGPGPNLDPSGAPPEPGGASFFDLIGMLAEPIAIYLGDVELPDGQEAENLEMARLHIDLLDLLRHKTRGNLSAEESGVLDDLLYRSRVRYVQKRG